MNRRGFLGLLGLAAGGVMLEEAIPFGRVWSFPKDIKIATGNQLLTIEWVTRRSLEILRQNFRITEVFPKPDPADLFKVGDIITFGEPVRYPVHCGVSVSQL